MHDALADAGPSLIELWELAEADDKQDIEGWRAPFDGVSLTSPEVKLSKRIQAEIRRLVDRRHHDRPTPATAAACSYGDVLVLVRRRGNLFDAVIQALKHAGIPVAGADRLKLTEHIAIIDLMNLADALLLPQDDLALAVALKSPLFGLDDDDLFTLAWDRKGSLREALTAHAAESSKFKDALDRLVECERRFRRRRRLPSMPGCSAATAAARASCAGSGTRPTTRSTNSSNWRWATRRKAPASLQGFMAWLRAADTEVKRDMEISRDEVRVMTVHGAKGLEASGRVHGRHHDVAVGHAAAAPDPTAAGAMAARSWSGPDARPTIRPCVADARKAMLDETEDEYRRLLYVAMTRAADRLIVAGCMPGNMNSVRENSWYDLIERGLANSGLADRRNPELATAW